MFSFSMSVGWAGQRQMLMPLPLFSAKLILMHEISKFWMIFSHTVLA